LPVLLDDAVAPPEPPVFGFAGRQSKPLQILQFLPPGSHTRLDPSPHPQPELETAITPTTSAPAAQVVGTRPQRRAERMEPKSVVKVERKDIESSRERGSSLS
jgi:hypothetical protein